MSGIFKRRTSKNKEKPCSEEKKVTESEIGKTNSDNGYAPSFMSSEIGRHRYRFEHSYLRDKFFADPEEIMNILLVENSLYILYEGLFKYTEINNPFHPEDFAVNVARFDGDHVLMMLKMPDPVYVPLCYRIYLLSDISFEKTAYYTIEKGATGGFLCGWTQQSHLNYDHLKNPEFEESERGFMLALEANIIIDLYRKRYGQQQ